MKPIKKNRPPTYTEAGYKRRLKKAHVDRDEAIACANEADRVVRVKDATIESLQKQITHWQTRCNGLADMVEAFQRSENSYSAQVKKLAVQASDGQIRHKALIGEIESLVEQRDQRDAELAQFREANAGWVERDEKHVAEIQRLEDQLTSARGLAKDRLERIQAYGRDIASKQAFAEQQRNAVTELTDRLGQLATDNDELSQSLREREAACAAHRAEIVQLTRQCDKNTGIRWTAEDYVFIRIALRTAIRLNEALTAESTTFEPLGKTYNGLKKRVDHFRRMLANIEQARV